MKNMNLKFALSFIVLFVISCNNPKTVVTNFINRDGSVRRLIEMKASENKFKKSDFQVPFDSTWTITDSVEISEKGDTTWVKRAEKLFPGIDEINALYKADSGINREIVRFAAFKKRFRWFNTEYIFSENVGKNMKAGYPVRNFLNPDELRWFYSPVEITSSMKNGADSLQYRAFQDTIDKKVEKWMISSGSSEWAHELSSLVFNNSHDSIESGLLKEFEEKLYKKIMEKGDDFDSLWMEGIIQKEIMGDSLSVRYKTEADSAANIAIDRLLPSFSEYSVRVFMPGQLVETNGFADSSGLITWPVTSDYFLTEQYTMIAKSKTINIWAWVLTALFLGFVLTGIVIGKKKG